MANERRPRRGGGPGPGAAPVRKPAASSHAGGGLFALDSEQQARLLIYGAVALIVAVAAGFLIFGYWYSVVRPRHRTVLQVADMKVDYQGIKRRLAYEIVQNPQYEQSQQALQAVPSIALQALEDELTVITQAEGKLGITVDDAEITQQLNAKLGVAANADQRQFADALRRALNDSGLSETDYRRMVQASTYDGKILAKFRDELPATETQAKVGVISTATEDDANKAIARINAGEDFSAVAKAVSKETDVQTTGGIKEYATKDALSAVFRDFAFTADVGALSAPLKVDASTSTNSAPQFLVVKVIDRSDQPLTEAQKGQEASQKKADWLKSTQDELRSNGLLKEDWTPPSQADALISISGDVNARIKAKQAQQAADQQRQDAQSTAVAQLTASPQAVDTPGAEATAVPPTADAGAGSPVAPSQPVAPGTNGQ